MSDQLTIRPNWIVRTLSWMRAISIVDRPTEFDAGTDFGADLATQPGYDPLHAMSAFAAFPWVYAAVNIVSGNMSGLPLYVSRGDERIDDHPVIDILARPNSRTSGVLFRRQLWADWCLTGNAYVLVLRGNPVSLIRLHPSRVAVITDNNGLPKAFEYNQKGSTVRYSWEDVLHIRGTSWEDDPKNAFGQGWIRALNSELEADLLARDMASKVAKKGRPDMIVSPNDDSRMQWTPEQSRKIKAKLDDMLEKTSGGALVLGSTAKVELLSFTPRDMEFAELRTWVRDSIGAVAGIPPIMWGQDTANFATAREQARVFWEQRRLEATLFEAEFSRLAEMVGRPGDQVRYDYSSISAFQIDRTERLQRVQMHWTLGMSLEDAYAYEGFEDAPVPDDEPEPEPPPQQEGVTRAAVPRPVSESGRAEVWKGFIDDVHGPVERALQLRMQRFFVQQRARYLDRSESALRAAGIPLAQGKGFESLDIISLLASALEASELSSALGPELLAALRRSYEAAARRIGVRVSYSPVVIDEASIVSQVVSRVNTTTEQAVLDAIREGVEGGESIGQIQQRIQRLRAFAAPRALTVARTETTRVANAGAVEAMQSALDQGARIEGKEWLSARDSNVRDDHMALDGQIVGHGSAFVLGPYHARFPGDFGDPSLDINCRCTILPVVG